MGYNITLFKTNFAMLNANCIHTLYVYFEEKRGDIVFFILSFRPSVRPSFLQPSRSRYLVYGTPPTVLLCYRYLGRGLKVCILFGHNAQINFCHFFHKMNLVIIAAKMNTY